MINLDRVTRTLVGQLDVAVRTLMGGAETARGFDTASSCREASLAAVQADNLPEALWLAFEGLNALGRNLTEELAKAIRAA